MNSSDKKTRQGRPTRRGKLIALLCVSLILTFLCAEFVFRVYTKSQYPAVLAQWANENKLYRLEEGDPIVYTLSGNAEVEIPMTWKPEVKWTARTNALGFRGDLPTGDGEEKYRILVLGDSYSFGWALDEGGDRPYPELLAPLLEEARATRAVLPTAEVLNASVPGYNTAQEWQMLMRMKDEFDPDLVLLGYVMNDAEPQGTVPPRPSEYYAGNISWLWDRLLMGMKLRTREPNYNYPTGFAADSPKWKASKAALTKIAQYCDGEEIDFLVAIFPDFASEFDATYPNRIVHDSVTAWATELGVEAIDFWPLFEGKDAALFRIKEDGHPNGLAHKTIAERLAEAIDRRR